LDRFSFEIAKNLLETAKSALRNGKETLIYGLEEWADRPFNIKALFLELFSQHIYIRRKMDYSQ
jgi:hypothetical protein